jgi:hypothetical protein
VIAGTNFDDAKMSAAAVAATVIRGITVRSTRKERIYRSADDPYYSAEDKDAMEVLKDGWIWVLPTTVLAFRGAIFMQHTLHGTNEPGTFRNDADTDGTDNAVDVSSIISVFRPNASIGELACLRVNIWK